MERLKYLCLYEPETAFDWGKFVVGTQNASINGRQLYDILRDEFELQMEMVCAKHVLAMTTVGDSAEGLERLAQALEMIDARIGKCEDVSEQKVLQYSFYQPKRAMEIDEAVDLEVEEIPLEQAESRILNDYIYLYPPGIPLLVPGEVLGKEQIEQIQYFERQGLDVHGAYIKESKDVKVVLHHG